MRFIRALIVIVVAIGGLIPGEYALAATSAIPNNEAPSQFSLSRAAKVDVAQARVVATNNQLAKLEPFVTRVANTQQLDETAARDAGIDPRLLNLATEIVAYQNELLNKHSEQSTTSAPDLTGYPRLRAFFDDATATATAKLKKKRMAQAVDVTSVHPCGDMDHPVPATNPPKVLVGPYDNLRSYLIEQGFHLTAGYACGRPAQENCGYDYTRGRAFVSTYGTCAAPAFRDQATRTSRYPGRFYLQGPEPNPEIKDYTWPVWNWGLYVTWWHRTF